ncbi:MAG: hypothetical protein FWF01_02110, partial [Alphaproteobacteria bacterium]|nr:hypothetical protein [Alphaproteobacteria bacterium]
MVEESENPTFDSLTPEQQEWVEGRANLRAAIDAMKTGRPTRAIEAGEIIVSLTETEKQLNKPFFDMVEQVRNDPDNPSFSGLPREVRGFAINGIYTGGIEMAEDAITAGRIEPVLKEAAYLALFGKGYIPYTIAHRAIQRYLPEPAANTASNTLLGGIAGPKGMLAAGTATAIYEILRPMGATAETVETAEQLPPDVREDLIAATYGLHRLADGRLVHDPVADSY